jgi:hypothetical protein
VECGVLHQSSYVGLYTVESERWSDAQHLVSESTARDQFVFMNVSDLRLGV